MHNIIIRSHFIRNETSFFLFTGQSEQQALTRTKVAAATIITWSRFCSNFSQTLVHVVTRPSHRLHGPRCHKDTEVLIFCHTLGIPLK